MKRYHNTSLLLSGFIILLLVSNSYASKDCRFAQSYEQEELLLKEEKREEFISKILQKEANFMKDIGYDASTGLTLEG